MLEFRNSVYICILHTNVAAFMKNSFKWYQLYFIKLLFHLIILIFLVFISYDTRRQKFVANMAWITDVDHYPSDFTFMFWDLADGKLLRLVSYQFCLYFIQTPSIVNAYNFVPSWHAWMNCFKLVPLLPLVWWFVIQYLPIFIVLYY